MTWVNELEDPAWSTLDVASLAGFARPALLTEGDQSPPFFALILRALAEALLELGCEELSIGDTIGKATTDEVRGLLEQLLPRLGPSHRLALHFHDTFGQATANALAAHAMGVTIFDASAGGIGGCPYAPGAPGNVATEALVAAFPGRTGIDLGLLRAAAGLVVGG